MHTVNGKVSRTLNVQIKATPHDCDKHKDPRKNMITKYMCMGQIIDTGIYTQH